MAAICSSFKYGMFEQWRITLKCRLSGQRINLPARYTDCTYIECFDLEAFLQIKTQKNLLVCPICQKEVEMSLANLRIDKYIETVMSTLPDVMQVELLPDGFFTDVHEQFDTVTTVIADEEAYVQDKNTPPYQIKQECLTKDQDHNNQSIFANESNLLSDNASIFTFPEKQSYGEFPVTSKTSMTRSKLISAVDNENQQYSTETAIQTPVQSSLYDPVAKPMPRKRRFPMNDRNNKTQTISKRSNGIRKKTNSTEMLYQCNGCSYASAVKINFDNHVRTHTGEKPFKCDQCSFACIQKSNLVIHTRIHTGEKPFKCSQCSYAGTQKGNLDLHVRTHTLEKLFKCDQCPYISVQKGNLNNHMRNHTSEKPFKCNECSYSTALKSTLDGHVRTHTGEKTV